MNELFDIPKSLSPGIAPQPRSHKQRAICDYLRINGKISLDQAVHLVGGNIYANHHKHVGAFLSNMVKRGLIRRKNPGHFTSVSP